MIDEDADSEPELPGAAAEQPGDEWDFVLPRVPYGGDLMSGGPSGTAGFSLDDLVGAIQNKAGLDKIFGYLSTYDHDRRGLEKHLNGSVKGFPSLC